MAIISSATSKQLGIDAYGLVIETFIDYENRKIKSPNVVAFHLVLHVISLTVGACIKTPSF